MDSEGKLTLSVPFFFTELDVSGKDKRIRLQFDVTMMDSKCESFVFPRR